MVAENRVLRREVAALNDELVSFARRAKSASTALEEEQRRSATQNEQSEALRSQLKELHETLDKLRQERDGALTDQAHVSGMHSSVIDSLTRRCDEAEAELERERNAHEQTRSEIAQQLSAQHEEHDSTARALADTQQQLDAARSLLNGHKAKATKAKQEYDSLRSEHDEYKARAARVLESKEKLISELKRSAVNGGTSAAATTTGMGGIAGAVSHAEFLEMTSERDNAREECALLRNEVQQLRHELLVAEQQASADAEDAAEELARVRTAVEDETQMRLEAEQDALVRVKEAERARDDALRLRQLAQAQLSERDADIEKLRRQLTVRAVNSSGTEELEGRVRTLTETLIKKQSEIERRTAECSTLRLQIENERAKREQEKRATAEAQRAEQYIGSSVMSSSGVMRPLSTLVPLGRGATTTSDGGLPMTVMSRPHGARVDRVREAANAVDACTGSVGRFLLRYPIARLFLFAYMVLLHFWVFFIVLTYSPESHSDIEHAMSAAMSKMPVSP